MSYYLHTLDRGKLEKFFLRQKHPEEYKVWDSRGEGRGRRGRGRGREREAIVERVAVGKEGRVWQ